MTTIDHGSDQGAAPRPSGGGAAVRPWPPRGLFPGSADEWTSLVRLAVLLAVIPALWVGVIPLTSPVLTPILAILGGYVILLAAGPRWVTGLGQADLTVGLDLVVTTLLVTVSGGIDSPFRYLYYLVRHEIRCCKPK
ncbi:MAG TPA: hypothetical protein VKV57_05065 [bacterium]|nr:hypothetical protein [bacterium]